MPVEIRELQIITVVKDAAAQAASPGGAKGSASEKDKIVAECVEQVLEILKQKNER
jgi:hypothetical protein